MGRAGGRVDTETGRRRPRQIGTYSSKRSATRAASAFSAAGDSPAQRETVGHLVDEWAGSTVDVSNKTRLQYEWAAGHIRAGIGGVRIDQLERQDASTIAALKEHRSSRTRAGATTTSL